MSDYAKLKTLMSKAPTHNIAGSQYKGMNPSYRPIRDNSSGMILGWEKSQKGIPYVKIR